MYADLYDNMRQIFNPNLNMPSVAEMHGLISGYICAGNKMNGLPWLESIMAQLSQCNPKNLPEARQSVLTLYEFSSQKLQSMDFDFELLLPEEDTPLQTRAEALSHWCQGFTIALDRAGIHGKDFPVGDTKDAIDSIAEIAQLDYEIVDVSNEDEVAYMEAMEFVRMAALLIHSDLSQNEGSVGQ